MRIFVLSLAVSLAPLGVAPAFAQAHDHGGQAAHETGVSTTPVDGAMGAAPTTFSVNFDHPMRLTALVITPRGGDPIAATVPDAAPGTSTTVPLPRLEPGTYTFSWTAAGADNHAMTGRVRYMVH